MVWQRQLFSEVRLGPTLRGIVSGRRCFTKALGTKPNLVRKPNPPAHTTHDAAATAAGIQGNGLWPGLVIPRA